MRHSSYEMPACDELPAAEPADADLVAQRLSRGRKLLHEQVLAFVESTLTRTNPGPTFASGVLSALPITSATMGKSALRAATATKAAAATKSAELLGMLGNVFWPVTAILVTLKLAVESGTPITPEEQAMNKNIKQNFWRMISGLAMVGIMLGAMAHYEPTHPYFVWEGMAVFILVSLMAEARHASWRWNSKTVLKGFAIMLVAIAEFTPAYIATTYYQDTTLMVLCGAYVILFLTLLMLGKGKLKRWDWWKLALGITGTATFWVMIALVHSYWSAHPVEFCVASLVLYFGFIAAKKVSAIWEAETSPDPQIRQLAEEARRQRRQAMEVKLRARIAINAEFTDLLKNQWAMTKKARIAMIFLFVVFVLLQAKTLKISPALFTDAAYAVIGLMSLSCVLTYFSWCDWRMRYWEKIKIARTYISWTGVSVIMPLLTNVLMLIIILRIFFNLDAPSISTTAAVMLAGIGIGILARGFGRLGK